MFQRYHLDRRRGSRDNSRRSSDIPRRRSTWPSRLCCLTSVQTMSMWGYVQGSSSQDPGTHCRSCRPTVTVLPSPHPASSSSSPLSSALSPPAAVVRSEDGMSERPSQQHARILLCLSSPLTAQLIRVFTLDRKHSATGLYASSDRP